MVSGTLLRLFVTLCVVVALIDALDLVLHFKSHAHFEAEKIFGFYSFYGFVGCGILVLASIALRKIVLRPEDYYDSVDEPSEDA